MEADNGIGNGLIGLEAHYGEGSSLARWIDLEGFTFWEVLEYNIGVI